MSVPQLSDSDMDVHFTKTKVTVTNATSETVLEGYRDHLRNLYMVPIEDPPGPPRVAQSCVTEKQITSRVGKSRVGQPGLPQQHSARSGRYEPSFRIYAWSPGTLKRKHGCMESIEANYYSTWPVITASRVIKYLSEPEPTTFGHLKMIRKNVRSTQPKLVPIQTETLPPPNKAPKYRP